MLSQKLFAALEKSQRNLDTQSGRDAAAILKN